MGAVMDTKKYPASTAMLNDDEPECKENQEPNRLINRGKETGFISLATNSRGRSFSEIYT